MLLISLHIQYANNPYFADELNEMEVKSILVSAITIYCGLFYLTGSLDDTSKFILFVVMLLANILFLMTWLKQMFSVGIAALSKRINCL